MNGTNDGMGMRMGMRMRMRTAGTIAGQGRRRDAGPQNKNPPEKAAWMKITFIFHKKMTAA
jgi:hypothetical protein